ncbi:MULTISPECIES: hypothetical protein [Paenibacillus]|uniref:Uncharacterized protein n=1 Tax=Paenibacillus vulneris TaxID=1133364 RepID=A0ABW3UVW8_9BACL|nr:hypothetical protein [Paenibacillus sp. 32352]
MRKRLIFKKEWNRINELGLTEDKHLGKLGKTIEMIRAVTLAEK